MPERSVSLIGVLTTTETARALACCRATVRNLIRSGQLTAFKVGKNWRVDPEALRRFIANAQAVRL